MDEDERLALCAEIASMIGIKHRKPGQITVKDFCKFNGIGEGAARHQLRILVKEGKLVEERVVDNGIWCLVYGKPV